jgi:hypothetical protein
MKPPLNAFLVTGSSQKNIFLAFSVLIFLILGLMTSTLTTGQVAAQAGGSGTPTATRTTSSTPAPEFQCSNLALRWIIPPFYSNNLRLFFQNQNLEAVELESVKLRWNDIAAPWDDMYLSIMALDDVVHWAGGADQNVRANGQSSVTTGQLTESYRVIEPRSTAVWTGTFFAGPLPMEDYLTLDDFSAHFKFQSSSGQFCDIFMLMPGEPTPTPTATLSPTPAPFECSNVNVLFNAPPFNLFIIQLFINNGNQESVELESVNFSWTDLAAPWNIMYMGTMDLDSDVHWQGSPSSNTHAGGRTSVATGQLTQGYRTISSQASAVWSGTFYSGPTSLEDYLALYDFEASFVFKSASGVTCTVELDSPSVPDSTPTAAVTGAPTPTETPNCATVRAQNITLQFGGFVSSGGVFYTLTNNSGRDKLLSGFDLVWPDATHAEIIGEPEAGYGLARVYVGGDTLGEGTLIWEANPAVKPGNTNLAPPYNNRTTSSGKGTWIQNGLLPIGMTTRIWLDFDDMTGKLSDFGAASYHFDSSRFKVMCTGGDDEDMTLTPQPTETLIELPTDIQSTTPAPAPTSTSTPTATDAAPQMTPTPSMTNSPSLVELLPNTSFEIDADRDKVPDGWQVKNDDSSSKDKLKCEGKNIHSGDCAYRFKADPDGKGSTLTFKASDVALTETVYYDFRAYVLSKALSTDLTLGKAKLVFTDGTAETIKLYPEPPYANYEPLAEVGQFDRAGRTLKKIAIQFSYPATRGKLWLDDVSFKISVDEPDPILGLP